jgi:hypothetical protein
VRFGVLPSVRIGHFAAEPEIYLCMRDAGLLPKSIDFFWFTGKTSNSQLCECIPFTTAFTCSTVWFSSGMPF